MSIEEYCDNINTCEMGACAEQKLACSLAFNRLRAWKRIVKKESPHVENPRLRSTFTDPRLRIVKRLSEDLSPSFFRLL